jgi:hypothetical protein
MKLLKNIYGIVLAISLLVACSGGTGGTGAGGTGDVSQGEVTKLGSVFVNGVEFDTSIANITRDGTMVAETQVLGMPAEIKGSINGDIGSALTVIAETAVKGTVTSITSGVSLIVMGQTVRMDDGAIIETLLNNDTLADLSSGSFVEVAGMAKPGGIIIATRLEEKASALAEYKVKGYIEPASITATTFDIGGLTIDYSSADMTDLPGGPVANALVEVKSSSLPTPNMLASKVEADGLSVVSAPEAEVEGYVRALLGTDPDYVFFINGQEVHTDGSTVFEGATSNYLAENIKVEAEGILSSGILNAYKLSLKDSVRMEGDIENLVGNTFNLKGMPDIDITVTTATEFNSSSDLFSDFNNGMHVRLRGLPATTASVTATRLDQRSADIDAYLQGPVDSVVGTVITVLGVAIDVNNFSFQDQDDVTMSQANFLAALQTGTPVKIQGELIAGNITWLSAELED